MNKPTASPFWSSDRFTSALAYAFELHRSDVRKVRDVPYYAHLMSVSSLVLQYGGNEDQAIAALLHDAAEDHGGRPQLDAIRARFGSAVADIVEVCTDCLVPEGSVKPDWRPRKSAYIANLRNAPAAAKLVVCCDKIDNLGSTIRDVEGDPSPDYWDGPNKGPDKQLWYYSSVAASLAANEPPARLAMADFERKVARLKSIVEAL